MDHHARNNADDAPAVAEYDWNLPATRERESARLLAGDEVDKFILDRRNGAIRENGEIEASVAYRSLAEARLAVGALLRSAGVTVDGFIASRHDPAPEDLAA